MFSALKGQVRRWSLLFTFGVLPNSCGNVKDDIDVLNQETSIVGLNAQAGQHTIAADSNNFMTEFGLISFNQIEKLKRSFLFSRLKKMFVGESSGRLFNLPDRQRFFQFSCECRHLFCF